MDRISRIARNVAALAIALSIGFGSAAAVLVIAAAVLPPFQPEDDDTLREFAPVAIAYMAWAFTTAAVLLSARRVSRPPRGGASRDIR